MPVHNDNDYHEHTVVIIVTTFTFPFTKPLIDFGDGLGPLPVEWIQDIWGDMSLDLFGTGPFHLQLGSTMLPMVRPHQHSSYYYH